MGKSSFLYNPAKLLPMLPTLLLLLLIPVIFIAVKHQQDTRSNAATNGLPPQGLYESCLPINSQKCLDRLTMMGSAGFKYVINYDQLNGTAAEQIAYANKAHSVGMQVIWAMNDPVFWTGNAASQFSDLAASCNCSDSIGLAKYLVGLVKDNPGTWGYYIGDEVTSGDAAKWKTYAAAVRQVDSGHPRLFISAEDCGTLGNNLKPFIGSVEVGGSDFYPWPRTDCPISTVTNIGSAVQSIADQNGKQSAWVAQAFSWAQYGESWVCKPWPSCSIFPSRTQMRQERDLAIAAMHPSMILWYSYFDIFDNASKIPGNPAPATLWSDLVWAADPMNSQPVISATPGVPTITAGQQPTNTPIPTLRPTGVPTPKPTANPTLIPSPTFIPGNTTTFGNTRVGRAVDTDDSKQFTAIKVILSSAAHATQMAAYVGKVSIKGTPQIAMAIYADNGNKPGTLIWGSAAQSITTRGWATVSVPNVTLQAGTYWVGVNASAPNTGFAFNSDTPPLTYQEWWGSFGNWPKTAPRPRNGIQPYQYSITITVQ